MRIGITGVTGLVGKALAAEARRKGHAVTGFSRNASRLAPDVEAMRSSVDWNACDLTGLDGLFHLAGESILGVWNRAKRERIRSSRVDSTRALVDRLAALDPAERPRVFVCGSAVGFYGDRGDEHLTESCGRGEGFLAEVCDAWEAEARRASELGVRVVMARFGMVIGAGGGSAPLLGRLFRAGLGGPLGNGKQWVSWIDLEDAASALLLLSTDPRFEGPVNVVSPRPVRNRELTRVFASVVRRPAFLPVPGFALRLVLRGMSELLLFSQQVEPQRLREAGFAWKRPGLKESVALAIGSKAVPVQGR